MEKQRLHYYEQLAELYPTIGKASTEIINLQSILYLPKGTEHFLSDIHGEFKAFSHVLRNGSGAVRKKIDDVFGHTLSTADKMSLATLIYYPQKKIELVRQTEDDIENWYKITLYRLIEVCKTVSSKYTRSKVRKALPEDYAYVIEELITEKQEVLNKEAYYEAFWNLGRQIILLWHWRNWCRGWSLIICIFSGMCMTAVRHRTGLWISWNNIIRLISSGGITIWYGWGQRPGSLPALHL